jgi:hypothetical protein
MGNDHARRSGLDDLDDLGDIVRDEPLEARPTHRIASL